MKIKFFVLLLCLTTISSTVAANCPDGHYFTGRMIQGQGVSYPECAPNQQVQQAPAQQQPPAPRGHWETRWGAIAIDGVKGKLGGVTNHKSKYAAETTALKECYSRGGGQGSKGCKIDYTYYNQCAAVAWGDAASSTSGRDSIQDANQDAIESCTKVTPNCVVIYNACSNAQWISN